jgi:hypothetical protein
LRATSLTVSSTAASSMTTTSTSEVRRANPASLGSLLRAWSRGRLLMTTTTPMTSFWPWLSLHGRARRGGQANRASGGEMQRKGTCCRVMQWQGSVGREKEIQCRRCLSG